MRDPLEAPPAARHPDSVFLQLLCLSAGVSLALSPDQPGGLEAALPAWLTTAWSLFLIIGAITVLAGAFWRRRTTGQLLEFAGRVVLVIGAAVYALAFVAVSGGIGKGDVVPLLVFGALCAWRGVQVLRPVLQTRDALTTMQDARRDREAS